MFLKVSIGDVILPQSLVVFRETELKHVSTLAPPHPVSVRYTERSHTVSSFSETQVMNYGLGGGTHRPLAWGVWGHQMLKIRKCQAKSLNRPLLFFSTWGPEEANPCFVIFHVRSAEKFQAIRSLRVLWTGRLVSKFPLNLEPIWKDIQTSIIITVRECVPGREYILGLWQTGAAFEQSDLSQYSLRVWRPRRDLSLV